MKEVLTSIFLRACCKLNEEIKGRSILAAYLSGVNMRQLLKSCTFSITPCSTALVGIMHVGSVPVLYCISFCHRTKSVHNVHILMLTLNCIKDVSRRQDSLLGEQTWH